MKYEVTLTDAYKRFTYDQDKVCTPEETIAKLKQKLAEVKLDILIDVRRVDTGRLDIPVYFSVCGKEAFEVIRNKKQLGKGCTTSQSQASACMELIERFSFFSFRQTRLILSGPPSPNSRPRDCPSNTCFSRYTMKTRRRKF